MDSTDVFEVMRTQLSARAYTDKHVSDDDVERILEAATWAPNAGNRQLWEFIVVRDTAIKCELADLYRAAMEILQDSMPGASVDRSEGAEIPAAGLTPSVRATYIAGADPRTAQNEMMKWGANLSETLQDVPVIVVVGYDRAGSPYSTDGVFKRFAEETVYTGVMPAVQNIMLAARALGLGTCLTTVANILEGKMKELLGVPESIQLVALLPLGYPSVPFTARKRIPVGEKLHRDTW